MTAPLLARCIASPPSSPRCVSPRWSRRGVSPCRAVAAPTGRSCSPIAPSQVDRWRRSRSSHGKGRRVPAAGKPPTFSSVIASWGRSRESHYYLGLRLCRLAYLRMFSGTSVIPSV
uniref:Uncharacterized protein n=1 Tax=Setaria viridis TaxID=4556 RepID=A0A4U6U4Z4_SETVI|nr:hypothetical protein SEVIR_6G026750v2 [Setaria viridis]